jgi:hypothetical protein
MKYWEIIADNLSKAGWSLGWVSAVNSEGRTIFVADAHPDDGKRYVVHADEKLSAFLELKSVASGLGANDYAVPVQFAALMVRLLEKLSIDIVRSGRATRR